jgi:hypothetical protein
MLREAGLDARMTLLRTRDRGRADLSVPYLGEFNHAICYVNLGKGFYIDATSRMSGFRELPVDDRDVPVLVMDERGFRFEKTGSDELEQNIERVETEVDLREDGSAALRRTLWKQGSFAPGERYQLTDPKKKMNQIAEYWNEHYAGAVIKNMTMKLLDFERPVSYAYEAEIPSFFVPGGEIILRASLIPSDYYRDFGLLKKRSFPVALSSTWSSRTVTRYRIPPGYALYRLPGKGDHRQRKFEAAYQYRVIEKENVLEVTSEISFKDYLIGVEEYPGFREFLKFISRAENEKIILIKIKTGAGGPNP